MTAPNVQQGDPIILGSYLISGGAFQITGYAFRDDVQVSPTGDQEKKTVDGKTVQETIKNPGLSFSGTMVVSDAATYDWTALPKGDLLDITFPGEQTPRKFVVDDSRKSRDTDTGEVLVALTAHHDYSMEAAYAAGPVDPDTGEPLSGLVRGRIVLYKDQNPPDLVSSSEYDCASFCTESWTDTSGNHSLVHRSVFDGFFDIYLHPGASVSSPDGDHGVITVPSSDFARAYSVS